MSWRAGAVAAWGATALALVASCDDAAPVRAEDRAAPMAAERVAAAVAVRAAPWVGTDRVVEVRRRGAPTALELPVDAAGLARLVVEAPASAQVRFDGGLAPAVAVRAGRATWSAWVSVSAPAAVIALPAGGPIALPTRSLALTVVDGAATLLTDALSLAVGPDRDLGLAHAGAGEVPTGAGVIDRLEAAPFYQGAAGPLTNARYWARATPVAVPSTSCSAEALDVTVVDRFTRLVVAKQRFAPEGGCGTVAPVVVRRWLRGSLVERGLSPSP
ncbi:MAG: hypothetical protein R2939_01260 [Kofleriaceae bacterium]